MTLSRALNSAYTGLSATSYRADVTAGNIANANTAGYVSRTVVTEENIVGGQGNGVLISGVERSQDQGLSRLRRDADSSVGRAGVLSDQYAQLNQALGTPGEGYGLFAAYEDFESGLRDLAATPESPALQSSVVASAQQIASQFNSLSTLANNMRTDADNNIASNVETVNNALYRLQDLNGDIAGLNQGAGDAVALEDERQRLLDQISEIIPIKDLERENGTIEVITESGVFLLAGEVKPLEFKAAGAVGPTASYEDGIGQLSGLSVGDQDLTPGTNGNFTIATGTLAGHFSVRDEGVPAFIDQIDSLAGDLITRLSDDSIDPSTANGSPGIFTDFGASFDPVNTGGVAGRLSINAAVDPAQGGTVSRLRDGLGATTEGPTANSEIINGWLDAMTSQGTAPEGTGLNGQYTVSELVGGVSSLIGENQVRHDALFASSVSRSNLLYDAEIQSSGVDTDLELQNLLIIEQSYAANARVVQTVSEMIDRLLQL